MTAEDPGTQLGDDAGVEHVEAQDGATESKLRWNPLRWIVKPRTVRLPLLFWLLLIVGLVAVLMVRPALPSPRTIIRQTERVVVITATPEARSRPLEPAPTATPVGSGGAVAFTMRHGGNSDIYMLAQGDGDLLRLTYDLADDRDPAWSPDGRTLAFASHRGGTWDIYLMEMGYGAVIRATRTPGMERNPAWSPDARWLVYEAYADGNLDIYIQNVESGEAQRLTAGPEPDYSPAWSPDGRHIAFTSYRNANKDIYILSLDDGSVHNFTATPDLNEDYPVWSPDATFIAYSAGVPGDETIWRIPFDAVALDTGGFRPLLFGVGGQPVWSPDGSALAFIFRQQSKSYLVAASTTGWALATEGYSSDDWIDGPTWTAAVLSEELQQRLRSQSAKLEAPLYTELLLTDSSSTYQLVNLPNVNGANAAQKLSDRVNDSYNALRQSVLEATGWDYLSVLGDSWRPMNHTPRPGQGRISWHVCGRAIDIDQGFLRTGQIELVREDIGGGTYWRVYIKAKAQDGSLGEPLRVAPWNLSARSNGGLATAQGGELKAIPEGYYVDFTTLAADYGWERRNALSNWRTSYYDIEWWHFQKTAGMSWYDCMLELYDEEEVTASYGELPWWTKRPEAEVQALP